MIAYTDSIEEQLAELDSASTGDAQLAVVDLIEGGLPAFRNSPTYWAKINIADACTWWRASMRSSSKFGLRISLLKLHQAFLPSGSYDENYCRRQPAIDRMPYRKFSRNVVDLLANPA